MTPEERALEAAWKICSAWDGKITKPVLRKAVAAALKEIEAAEAETEEPDGIDWFETSLDIIHQHKKAYAVQRDELKQRGKGNQHVYAGFVGVCDSISQAIHDARATLSTQETQS